MKRLLLLPLLLGLTTPVQIEAHPNSFPKDDIRSDEKHLLYHQRGCHLLWLDGDFSNSIKHCNESINLIINDVPSAYGNRIGISFESRGLSRIELGDNKGACEDWGKAIKVGYSPMPSYWSAFSKTFRKKKLTLGHAQAMEETKKAVPYGNYDEDYEVKQIKSFCKLVK